MPFTFKPIPSSTVFFCTGLMLVLLWQGVDCASFAQEDFAQSDTVLGKAKNWMRRGYGIQAKAIYQSYLAQHPNHPEALMGMAEIAFREGDYTTAQQHLARVIKQEPYNVDAMAELAHVYHHRASNPITGDAAYKGKAIEYFQQAEALNPGNIKLLTYQGLWLLDEGDRISAQRKFGEALSQNPNFVPALLGMTRYHMAIGNVQQAKSLALQATEMDDQNSDAYFLMAQMLANAEHPDKAVTYALKSEAVDFGTHPERDLFLAEQYEKLGKKAQALQYFNKVSKLNPNHSGTLLKMARLYEQTGQPEQSTALYQKAAQNDPSIAEGMLTQAATAVRTEQTQAAYTQYAQLLAMAPERMAEISSGLANTAMIEAYYGQANPSALAQAMQALAANNNPALPETLSQRLAMDRLKLAIAQSGAPLENIPPPLKQKLTEKAASNEALVAGEALFLLGQYAEAKTKLETVDGITANGYMQLGDRLLALQALDSARILYQRGLEMESLPGIRQGLERINAKQGLAQQRLTEGNSLFTTKNYPAALRKYQDAQKIRPEMDSTYLRIGDTYEQMKDTVSAFAAYTRAVQLNPGLMSSEGFAKRYAKLQKAAAKAAAKNAKTTQKAGTKQANP